MTVSSEQSSVTYTGNGVTTLFAIPYYFLSKTHIQVSLTDSAGVIIPKVLDIDYTVAGAGNEAGGSLTFLVAPPNLSNLIIARNVPATQLTEYRPNDDFPAESHERALDKLTMLVQQAFAGLTSAYTQLSKTIRTPESIPALPEAAIRANKMLVFDASGNPYVLSPATGSAADLAIALANKTDPLLGSGLIGLTRTALLPVTAIDTVLSALSSLPVSVWEFADQITSKPDPDNFETWDWTPAADAMYAALGTNYPQSGLRYGKSAYFPAGRYGVTHPVGPTRLGINTIGEGSLTSVIYAMPGFVGDYVLRGRHASGAALGGVSVYRLGVDCNGQACGGLDWEDSYDCNFIHDVRISRVHINSIGARFGSRLDAVPGQPVSQTLNVVGLFVYKEGAGATVPTVVIQKVQEAQFTGCKSWAGGYGGVGRGNTTAWYIEDSRSVDLLGCSSAGAQNYGIEVRASTKTTDGIRVRGHLYENCNGTMKTSSSNATNFPLKTLVHDLPRIEAPSSGGFDLGGLYGAMIDAGVSTGTIQIDCDQCQINAQHLPNWIDNTVGTSKRNIIDTYPNAIANYKAFSKQIAVVAPTSTPNLTLRRGDSTDHAGFEHSSSASVENGGRLYVNLGGTQFNVFRYDHTRTFFGPGLDNTYSCGHPSFRSTVVYATTGTINTSDAREKTPVRPFTAGEISAAKAMSKEIGVYKWLASIQEKGDDARNHIGMTVQRAIEIMEANGLDPFGYGFICYDEWDDSYEVVPGEYEEVNGEVIEIKPETTKLMREAGNLFSFRDQQLYAFIAAGVVANQELLEANQELLAARIEALEKA